MLTGLVYAAVIALWAVVLVPQWLRRHDKNAEQRTSLTFTRAMRTLERRRTTRGVSRAPHEMDVVVAGARSKVHEPKAPEVSHRSAIDDHLDSGSDPFVGGEEEDLLRSVRMTRARADARERATHRRKQVLQALIALSVISVVLGFMGVLPVFLAFVAPFATGLFWYAARQQTNAAAAAALREQRRDRAKTNVRNSSSSSSTAQATRSARTNRRTARPASRYVEKTAGSSPSETYAATGTEDVRILSNDEKIARRSAAATGGRWDRVESPLPTYVNSARGSDSDWSSKRMLEQAEALRAPELDAEAELGLDEYVNVPGIDVEESYERRRAVNE